MSQFWSETARCLSPYVPGEQPRVVDLIKLNTNEHPLAPANSVLAAIANLEAEGLRRYPDPQAMLLRQAIASAEGLSPAQVFVGNGSDEVLAHAFQALLKQSQPLLLPDITYSFYQVWAQLYGIELTMTPLAESKSNQTGEMHANIWVNEFGPNKTRVFATTIGHHNETMLQDQYMQMITRGLLWAAGKPVAENINSVKK